jgi:hypothetical protein
MSKAILSLALQWRQARATRLAKQKEVEELEKIEKGLKDKVITLLKKSASKAVSDGTRMFKLVPGKEAVVEDWPALYQHIKKTGEFELLQRRVSATAVQERWESGIIVPGVSSIPVDKLSDTQA